MADVTVLGGGIFGLSVAYSCLTRGARVRVIEKTRIGAGASGGLVGALAPHTPERWDEKKEFQLQSLMMAKAYWQKVDTLSGLSAGYAQLGRLQPIRDAHTLELARERIGAAKKLWRGGADWQVVARSDYGAWAPQSPTGLLVFDTLSARMQPRRAAASLTRAITRLGGEIVIGEAPMQGKVVHATGYRGLLALCEEFQKPVGNGVKGQSILLRYDAKNMPQLFADGIHVVPHEDGTVAIGSTSERYFSSSDTTDDLLDDILSRALAAFPVLLGAETLERWAGVRPRAKTRAPMLGPYPGRDGHFIANGGFKIGFGMAPKVGEVMAELLLEGKDGIPEDFRVLANL